MTNESQEKQAGLPAGVTTLAEYVEHSAKNAVGIMTVTILALAMRGVKVLEHLDGVDAVDALVGELDREREAGPGKPIVPFLWSLEPDVVPQTAPARHWL